MNRRVLLFGDVCAEDSAPVDLDRRVDDFRAINSITLREQIVSDLASGRNFFEFFGIIDRRALPPQISSLSLGRPEARHVTYLLLGARVTVYARG